jgi:hypothetical protein
MEKETISMEWKDSRDTSNVYSLPREVLREPGYPVYRRVCLEIQPPIRSGKNKNSENHSVVEKQLGAGMEPYPKEIEGNFQNP